MPMRCCKASIGSGGLPEYVGHAPRVVTEGNPFWTGWTHAPALAGEGDQIVLALVTVRAGKTMREDAAIEITAKRALNIRRR
jgi:hypothetical protein